MSSQLQRCFSEELHGNGRGEVCEIETFLDYIWTSGHRGPCEIRCSPSARMSIEKASMERHQTAYMFAYNSSSPTVGGFFISGYLDKRSMLTLPIITDYSIDKGFVISSVANEVSTEIAPIESAVNDRLFGRRRITL